MSRPQVSEKGFEAWEPNSPIVIALLKPWQRTHIGDTAGAFRCLSSAEFLLCHWGGCSCHSLLSSSTTVVNKVTQFIKIILNSLSLCMLNPEHQFPALQGPACLPSVPSNPPLIPCSRERAHVLARGERQPWQPFGNWAFIRIVLWCLKNWRSCFISTLMHGTVFPHRVCVSVCVCAHAHARARMRSRGQARMVDLSCYLPCLLAQGF